MKSTVMHNYHVNQNKQKQTKTSRNSTRKRKRCAVHSCDPALMKVRQKSAELWVVGYAPSHLE